MCPLSSSICALSRNVQFTPCLVPFRLLRPRLVRQAFPHVLLAACCSRWGAECDDSFHKTYSCQVVDMLLSDDIQNPRTVTSVLSVMGSQAGALGPEVWSGVSGHHRCFCSLYDVWEGKRLARSQANCSQVGDLCRHPGASVSATGTPLLLISDNEYFVTTARKERCAPRWSVL